jgi:hypothetical protein
MGGKTDEPRPGTSVGHPPASLRFPGAEDRKRLWTDGVTS